MQLKKEIKIMLGCLRRADEDFKLIEDGDKIAVGIRSEEHTSELQSP